MVRLKKYLVQTVHPLTVITFVGFTLPLKEKSALSASAVLIAKLIKTYSCYSSWMNCCFYVFKNKLCS